VTDNILENGLAQLKGAAAAAGHELRLVDWARIGFHATLAPWWLTRVCRFLLRRAIEAKDRGDRRRARLWAMSSLPLQQLQTAWRRRRMRARLTSLARDIVADGVKILGVKLWYGEALEWAEKLVKEVRRLDPDVLFVAGGPLVSLYGNEFMADSTFDVAAVAQGEAPLLAILDCAETHAARWDKEQVMEELACLAQSGRLMNVIYRRNGQLGSSERVPPDCERFRLPLYEEADMEGKGLMHVVRSSLGCSWGKCHFCAHPLIYPGFYPRPTAHVIEEIVTLLSQGVGFFRFAGSDTPPSFGVEIARQILSLGLKVEFGMGLRGIRGIRDPGFYARAVSDFEWLAKAGLRDVFMGGETGHAEINEQVMNKGLHPDEVVWTIRALREGAARAGAEVKIGLAFIFPTPLMDGVTLDEVFELTVSMIQRARPDAVAVNPPVPFLGTVWEKQRDRFGFRLSDDCLRAGMRYEFVPYKPPSMWPDIGLSLNGRAFKAILLECQRLRERVEALGIPTDLTDEHFAVMRAIGIRDVHRFKRETLLDILSGDYENLDACYAQMNLASRRLAAENAEDVPRHPVSGQTENVDLSV
jgi:radical SAM superfamily enzyme YgiQ (UPF0313 family)